MNGTEVIETERLILRPFTLDDAKGCFENYTSDPQTTLYLTWDAHDSLAVTEEFIRAKLPLYMKEDHFDWVVTLKDQNKTIIGAISCVNFVRKDRYAEIGYCYGSCFWHRGYATEALKAVIRYLFLECDVEVISARYISVNERSGKVMKKCHMSKTAVLKEFGYNEMDNRREDVIVRSLSKERFLHFYQKGRF